MTTNDLCKCGHSKNAHLHEEGECKLGFFCLDKCAKFDPTVNNWLNNVSSGSSHTVSLFESVTNKEAEETAAELESIRNQLTNLANEIPMTNLQRQHMDAVRQRMWNLYGYLIRLARKPETNGER